MLNAVGREIPEEILERTGKEVFQGNNYKDGKAFQKASPKVTPVMRNDHDKMVKDIHEALVKCNAHDGMTVSFHHHFREGDLVVCMVMEEIDEERFTAALALTAALPERVFTGRYDQLMGAEEAPPAAG